MSGALDRLRTAEANFTGFDQAATAASENVAFAPARWRSRGTLSQYVEGADHVTYALRNVRVLARRVMTAIGDGEQIPECLPTSIGLLGDAVDLLREEWAKGAEPDATRERALRAAAESGRAYDEGVGFSGGVVVAQIRTTVSDLLRATGIEYAEAPRLVRRAVGWQGRGRVPPASTAAGPGPAAPVAARPDISGAFWLLIRFPPPWAYPGGAGWLRWRHGRRSSWRVARPGTHLRGSGLPGALFRCAGARFRRSCPGCPARCRPRCRV